MLRVCKRTRPSRPKRWYARGARRPARALGHRTELIVHNPRRQAGRGRAQHSCAFKNTSTATSLSNPPAQASNWTMRRVLPGSRVGAPRPEAGRFEELSRGEREQMGIIAHPAYADLFKEAGQPTLVMLDDSLGTPTQFAWPR